MRKNARLLLEAARNFERDDGYAMASHIALAGLTAIFPFLIVVTSLAGLFGVQPLADEASSAFFDIWPPRVAAPILLEIHNVLSNRHGGLLTISAALGDLFFIERRRGLADRTQPRLWRARRPGPGGGCVSSQSAMSSSARSLCSPWRSCSFSGPILWEAALSQAPALGAFNAKVDVGRYCDRDDHPARRPDHCAQGLAQCEAHPAPDRARRDPDLLRLDDFRVGFRVLYRPLRA